MITFKNKNRYDSSGNPYPVWSFAKFQHVLKWFMEIIGDCLNILKLQVIFIEAKFSEYSLYKNEIKLLLI